MRADDPTLVGFYVPSPSCSARTVEVSEAELLEQQRQQRLIMNHGGVEVTSGHQRLRVGVELVRPVPRAEGTQYPAYSTSGAGAFDLRAAAVIGPYGTLMDCSYARLPPGRVVWFAAGIRTALPHDYGAIIQSRSGMGARDGLVVAQGVGLIDSDYRGEWMVPIKNVGDADAIINLGDRIAQARLVWAPQAYFDFDADIDNTQRAEGGFGSTGRT